MRANRWTGLAVLIALGVGASSLWAMPEERDRSAETSARRVQLLGAKQHARSRGMRPEPEKKEDEKKRAAKGRQAGGAQKADGQGIKTHRTYGRLVLDRKEEKKQKGSKGQSTVVRRRRVIRQTSHRDMPERSNKDGEVRGRDRADEVKEMNEAREHNRELENERAKGRHQRMQENVRDRHEKRHENVRDRHENRHENVRDRHGSQHEAARERTERGSEGTVRRRRVLRTKQGLTSRKGVRKGNFSVLKTTRAEMPERSNKDGVVRGKDRAAEVRDMNGQTGHGKADARKGGGKIRVKKGKGKRRKKR